MNFTEKKSSVYRTCDSGVGYGRSCLLSVGLYECLCSKDNEASRIHYRDRWLVATLSIAHSVMSYNIATKTKQRKAVLLLRISNLKQFESVFI